MFLEVFVRCGGCRDCYCKSVKKRNLSFEGKAKMSNVLPLLHS